MLEPPRDLSDDQVLATVRAHWPGSGIDRVEHLAVGSGAHHWRASAGWRPTLFVTYDAARPPEHAGLEAAHATAAELAFRLDVVVAGLASETGGWTVPVAGSAHGVISVTPWVQGERAGDGAPADRVDAERIATGLARLHAVPAPSGTPRWQPLAARRPAAPGQGGPLTGAARDLLAEHADEVGTWTDRYDALAAQAVAAEETWVVTHGAPDTTHQLRTPVRTLLVGWGSVAVAPRERDLLALVRAGYAELVDPDPAMLELADLDRRLREVGRHAGRLAAEHPGGPDDLAALSSLRHELRRPPVLSC